MTGGTAGIGFGITAHLLQHNAAKIILLSQKEEHADEAIEALKEYGDTSKVQWIQLDLKDLKQTDSVAKQLQSENQIDAVRLSILRHTHEANRGSQLICNAGEGVGKYNQTVDGLGTVQDCICHVRELHLRNQIPTFRSIISPSFICR